MLFRKQRNQFFEIIVENNLSIDDFKEATIDSNGYDIRFIKDKRFIYTIRDSGLQFKASFSPMMYGEAGNDGLDTWKNWENAIHHFKRWLKIVKEEFETPDLWAEAKANSKLFALNPAVPDEKFNASELRQLEGQVRQLVQGLAALALPAHAQQLLTETVQEIPEKASRFTKKELEGWFMGAFISQVTNLTLSPEHVAAIGHLIKTTFMGLLQLH